MENERDHIQRVLQRFAEGKCSEEEIGQLHAWLDKVHEQSGELESGSQPNVRAELKEAIDRHITADAARRAGMVRKIRILQYATAAILILGVLGTAFYWFGRPAAAWREYASGDRIRQIVLGDGTRIWMNTNSTIRIRRDFEKHRTVDLISGELYCEVTHNAKAPFEINSGTFHVKDLGTAFSLSRLEKMGEMKVSMVQGLVEVSAGGKLVASLSRGQRLRYIPSKVPTVMVDSVSAMEANGWMGEGTVLHGLCLTEMMAWIEMHYGIRVVNELAHTPGNKTYEIQLEKNASATDMIDIFNLMLQNNQIRLELKDSVIRVRNISH